jgi:nucleotide-binding universal stress UspA family protein
MNTSVVTESGGQRVTQALRTIVFVTDGSMRSRAARSVAADIARHSGAGLHVITQTYFHAPPAAYARGHDMSSDVPDVALNDACSVLNDECQAIRERGATVAARHVAVGRTLEVIIETASRMGAELIVLGDGDPAAVSSLLAGTRGDVSVLVVPGSANPGQIRAQCFVNSRTTTGSNIHPSPEADAC